MEFLNAETLAEGIISAGNNSFATTCSRWSTTRRVMGTPFPGPYSFKHHPWIKGFLDSKASFNVTLKSAQSGFSEAAINRTLWTIDKRRMSVLYVLPTKGNASDFSKTRFDAACHLSPYIRSLFTDTNSVGLKTAGEVSLYIRGSRSDSDLKSIPTGVIVLDEMDEMSPRAIKLAEERMSGHLRPEQWRISTPTIPEFGVHESFLTTTQEVFTFKCPCCSKKTHLRFPDCLEVCGEVIGDPDIHKSFLKCAECGGKLQHELKHEWLSSGIWVPTKLDADPDRRGFSINQLYSATITPAMLAAAYIESRFSEAANQEWNNSKLGLPFLGDSSQLSHEIINRCLGNYNKGTGQPDRAGRLITIGVDQGKTGYYVVCEWSFDPNSRDHVGGAYCKVLDYGSFAQQDEGWGDVAAKIREWQCLKGVIDADPEISDARRFAKAFKPHFYLSRYRGGNTGREFTIVEEDSDAPIIQSNNVFWVGEMQHKFRSNMIELPVNTSELFKKHMRGLVKRYQKDESTGNYNAVFKKVGEDHYFHCLVYAFQAMVMKLKNGEYETI